MKLKIGKLENTLLKKLILSKTSKTVNKNVLLSGDVGSDCGYVKTGENIIAISTDPITATEKEIGKLAMYISTNDVATFGQRALGITLTLLLPKNTDTKTIEKITTDACKVSKKINVPILGGHTEITDAVSKPIIISTAFATKKKIRSQKIFEGDKILVSKHIALEGTYILGKEKTKNLIEKLSVIEEGIIADKAGAKYMHDITEGGILGAIYEASELTKTSIKIFENKLPMLDITKTICGNKKIDPYKLISSGSMLIIVDAKKVEAIHNACKKKNILITEIGEVKKCNSKVSYFVRADGTTDKIQEPKADEIYKE